MLKKYRPASRVKGSTAFANYFTKLDKKSHIYKDIDSALMTLKRDCMAGVRIQQNIWPKIYVQKYGITNLFKFNLEEGFRLLYTVITDLDGLSVVVLESLNHKEYEKRFGYNVT
jgi:hypothetical protein